MWAIPPKSVWHVYVSRFRYIYNWLRGRKCTRLMEVDQRLDICPFSVQSNRQVGGELGLRLWAAAWAKTKDGWRQFWSTWFFRNYGFVSFILSILTKRYWSQPVPLLLYIFKIAWTAVDAKWPLHWTGNNNSQSRCSFDHKLIHTWTDADGQSDVRNNFLAKIRT